jgi:methionine synthase II (cobalamin-independent)
MDAAKLEKLNSIKSSLEDLQHSQIALVQKVAQLEVNLMNNPDKEVEEGLTQIYSNASDNADLVKDLLDKFNIRVDQANKEYSPGPEENEAKEL